MKARLAPPRSESVVDAFHRLYYTRTNDAADTWRDTRFLGCRILKNPLDLWIYQEILFELKPDLIIETGTAWGGSALWMASLCDLIGHGEVVTIDIKRRKKDLPVPVHPRITYLLGSSTSDDIVGDVRNRVLTREKVLVVLDSDHSREHVLNELRIYGPLVTPGSYVIVEDTNVNGHPVAPSFGPGPMEAVDSYLEETDEFKIDLTREKLLFTFNPRGYLRKRDDAGASPQES
jgi:cephalosporin hydroxylase